jgi:hypothetical protein
MGSGQKGENTVDAIWMTCCALHNWLLESGEPPFPPTSALQQTNPLLPLPTSHLQMA